jgi:Icc protein
MKFIHITDTHLVKNGELLHGLDPQKRFELCVRSVRENHSDAHCIVVTGDLADRGEQEAYQFFNEQITSTGLPVYSILGNHDERDNYSSQFPNAELDSDGFVQTAIETPVGVFLLLDTKLDGSSAGTFCGRRQQWLRDQLNKYSSTPVFLFMHHPPFDLHLPCIDKIGLDAKDAFSSVVKTHGNVRHIFFGHAHRPLSGNWRGISFSSMRGTNHQVKLDFKDKKIHPIAENPEYTIVFIDDDQLVVHTHSYLNDYG